MTAVRFDDRHSVLIHLQILLEPVGTGRHDTGARAAKIHPASLGTDELLGACKFFNAGHRVGDFLAELCGLLFTQPQAAEFFLGQQQTAKAIRVAGTERGDHLLGYLFG